MFQSTTLQGQAGLSQELIRTLSIMIIPSACAIGSVDLLPIK